MTNTPNAPTPSPNPLPGRKLEMFARKTWVCVIDMTPSIWLVQHKVHS